MSAALQHQDIDLEATPLLIASEAEENVAQSSSFKASAKNVIVVGALLALSGLAAYSYSSHSEDNIVTKAMHMMEEVVYVQEDGYRIKADVDVFQRDDVAFCEGSFVMGVTKRTAARGCVTVSHQDLFSELADKNIMPIATYCLGSTLQELAVDFDMIKHSGVFENPETGYHTISQFSPGEDVDVVIFSGENFDGQNTTVRAAQEDGRLPTKFYPDGTSANDNVKSFIIRNNADHWFAGKECGLHTQVCPMVVSKEDGIKPQPDGCALFTDRDIGVDDENMLPSASTKAVRICADSEAGELNMDRTDLTAMKLIQDFGDKKSTISYYNEGDKIQMKYFDSSDPDQGEMNLSPGSFVGNEYESGQEVNDNVYSLKMTSDASKIPPSC